MVIFYQMLICNLRILETHVQKRIHDFWVESAKLLCVLITTSCFGRTKAPVPIIWNTSRHGMLLFYFHSLRTYYQQELSSVSFKMACLLLMPLTQQMKKQSRVWYIQYAFLYANHLYTIMFLLDLDQLKCKKQLRTLKYCPLINMFESFLNIDCWCMHTVSLSGGVLHAKG